MNAATLPAPAAGPRWRAIAAQARIELVLMVRSAESLVVTLGIPLGLLVFFSVVDVLPTGDRSAVEFLVPGVLAISAMSTGLVAVAIQTAFERKYAVLKRLGGTPLTRGGFVTAKVLAMLVVLGIQASAVLAIASAGLGWETRWRAVPLVLVALLVGAATFTSIGLLMAGALRAELTLALSNAVFLLLLLVSGLAFDLQSLPGPLASLGLALPSGALGQLLRAAVDGSFDAGSFIVVGVWGVLAAGAAVRTFRWEP